MLGLRWFLIVMWVVAAAPAAAQDAQPSPGAEQAPAAQQPAATANAPDAANTGTSLAPTPEETAQASGPSLQEEQAAMSSEPERSNTDPYEDPTKGYWFLGGFYRHTWTPAFILKLFLDDITTANNPAAGIEATYRKDNLDIVTNVYWQGYGTYGPFRASGDPLENTEMIDSSLSMVGAGVNFLWSTPFNDVFSLQYGIDIGIGYVLGDLTRTEAYRTQDTAGPDQGEKAGWAPCAGPGDPGPTQGVAKGYCDLPTGWPAVQTNQDGEKGAHYNIKARRWTNGGSVPNVWFRLALPHLALRIKPIKQLVMRVDFGFDLFSGFFVGGAISAGLN